MLPLPLDCLACGCGMSDGAGQLPQAVQNSIPIIAVLGPTASGKTSLSLDLAHALGGADAVEIISADAFQLYRGLNIGTAKLMPDQRQGIVHHQIDVLDIMQPASVAAYQARARADIQDIHRRGKIPLVVGGSGLYVAGLLDELDFPGHDEQIRAELMRVLESDGLNPLVQELQLLDPVGAANIDLRNSRRVVRALEVLRMRDGRVIPSFPRNTSHYAKVLRFGLQWQREIEIRRIEERTAKMFAAGMLEETHSLLECGLREAPTASKATGYREAIAVLDGVLAPLQVQAQVAVATRQLARKQRTWFKADPRIQWWQGEHLEGAEHANAISAMVSAVMEAADER